MIHISGSGRKPSSSNFAVKDKIVVDGPFEICIGQGHHIVKKEKCSHWHLASVDILGDGDCKGVRMGPDIRLEKDGNHAFKVTSFENN